MTFVITRQNFSLLLTTLAKATRENRHRKRGPENNDVQIVLICQTTYFTLWELCHHRELHFHKSGHFTSLNSFL